MAKIQRTLFLFICLDQINHTDDEELEIEYTILVYHTIKILYLEIIRIQFFGFLGLEIETLDD